MIITAADIQKSVVEDIRRQRMSRPYTQQKDIELDRELARMCDGFYGYIKTHKKVPTMREFANYYCMKHSATYDGEDIELDGKYKRIHTKKQLLWDRLYIGYTAYVREVQLLVALQNRGIDTMYMPSKDKDGIDIICIIKGHRVGVASYSATADGVRRKVVKNKIHDYDMPMVDAPILLGGSNSVQLENGIYLYNSAYIDGIAEQVRSSLKYDRNSVC